MVLIAAMGEVLRAANPERPATVTQRAYDAARVAEGYGDTPRADRLAARFGLPWPELRRRVIEIDDPARILRLSEASKSQRRRVVTKAECVAAVKLVAARLEADELTVVQYDEVRAVIDAEAARRHRHGRHLLPLPSSETIKHQMPFADAAEAAGVRVPRAPTRAALPRTDAVVAFIEAHGFCPRQPDLQWFGRRHRIQLVKHASSNHSKAVADARVRFEKLGRWFPPKASKKARPEGWEHLGEGSEALALLAQAHPRERTRGEGFSPAEVREAIAKAYDALEPGQSLTSTRYRALTKPLGLPSLKTIYEVAAGEGATFRHLVRDEVARRARDARARERE